MNDSSNQHLGFDLLLYDKSFGRLFYQFQYGDNVSTNNAEYLWMISEKKKTYIEYGLNKYGFIHWTSIQLKIFRKF